MVKSVRIRGVPLKLLLAVVLSLAIVAAACAVKTPGVTPPSSLSSTTTSTSAVSTVLNQYQAAYRLHTAYPDYFWCDPDFYPVAREGAEQANANSQFSSLQGNRSEFAAILGQLNLPLKPAYSDSEKLSIYREYKKISQAVSLTPEGGNYIFTLRVGKNQGQTLHGTISGAGGISGLTAETSFNTCPICLSAGTLIDTPQGMTAVEAIQAGRLVWTQDRKGRRVSARVLKISHTSVPSDFQILRISLEDGRMLEASPGHPSAEMKALSEYRVGDILSGGRINMIEPQIYNKGATYDLLPGGDSGLYWANGVLLKSTLQNK